MKGSPGQKRDWAGCNGKRFRPPRFERSSVGRGVSRLWDPFREGAWGLSLLARSLHNGWPRPAFRSVCGTYADRGGTGSSQIHFTQSAHLDFHFTAGSRKGASRFPFSRLKPLTILGYEFLERRARPHKTAAWPWASIFKSMEYALLLPTLEKRFGLG